MHNDKKNKRKVCLNCLKELNKQNSHIENKKVICNKCKLEAFEVEEIFLNADPDKVRSDTIDLFIYDPLFKGFMNIETYIPY